MTNLILIAGSLVALGIGALGIWAERRQAQRFFAEHGRWPNAHDYAHDYWGSGE